MKKINIFSLLLAILLLGNLTVAAQNSFVAPVAPKDATYITVDPKDAAKNFLSESGTQSLSVTTNLTLYTESTETWCTPSVIDNAVFISVAQNTGENERTATVTIYGKDNKSATIEVVQLGSKANILVNESEIDVDQFDATFTLGITSSVVFEFELPTWVGSPSIQPAVGFNNYEFALNEINEGEVKNGEIVIKTAGNIVPEIRIPITHTHIGYPRFAVISDVHFGNSKGEGPLVKVPKAFKNLTSHGELDALFIVGDLTESGTAAQYTQLVTAMNNKDNFTNPVDTIIYMMGNHDNYSSGAHTIYSEGLKPLNGNKAYPLDQYIVIKGYPFITISQRNSSNSDMSNAANGTGAYPVDVQNQLKAWLAQAAADFPGKPIFVFTHVPPRYGCYGAWPDEGNGVGTNWSMWPLNPILNEYPQVVIFSGHSHFPLGDPRSIHQGVDPNSTKKNFYTSINTGSTTYGEVHSPSVNEGITPPGSVNATEGQIVTIQGNGDVLIQRYDTYRNTEMLPENPWLLKAPHDGTMFAYADIRDKNDANPNSLVLRDGLPAPTFSANAKIEFEAVSSTSVTVTYPQATDDEYVFRYRINFKNPSGTSVKEYFQFSQFFLYSGMADPLSATITGLTSGMTYTVEITAYDSYDNISGAITGTFTMEEYTPDPDTVVPTADILDIVFNEDGTASDVSELNNTVLVGSTAPTTTYNEDYKRYVANIASENTSYYRVDYAGNQTIKDAFTNGFTIETLFKQTAASGTQSPISAQESGGTGIENNNGDVEIWTRINGAWVTMKGAYTISGGKYYHVVYTYDPTAGKVLLYVDGNRVGEIDAVGTFTLPSNELAHWIGIGGDASTSTTTVQASFAGEIAITRMYSKPLTRDEVYFLHKEIGDETTEPEDPAPAPTGSWLFEDTTDLLKATTGNDLLPGTELVNKTATIVDSAAEAGITAIAGPSDTNKAINIPKTGLLKLVHNLKPEEEATAKTVDNYTVMFDVRLTALAQYYALLQTKTANGSDADFFINKSNKVGLSSTGWGYGNSVLALDTWYRIIISVTDGIPTSYIDGNLELAGTAGGGRWNLESVAALLFADDSAEDCAVDVAEIAFWDTALTAAQAASLKGVK